MITLISSCRSSTIYTKHSKAPNEILIKTHLGCNAVCSTEPSKCQCLTRICDELTYTNNQIWLEIASIENTGSKYFLWSPRFRLARPKGISLHQVCGPGKAATSGKVATHVNCGLVIQAYRVFLSMDNWVTNYSTSTLWFFSCQNKTLH